MRHEYVLKYPTNDNMGVASFPGSPEREINMCGEPGIFSLIWEMFVHSKATIPFYSCGKRLGVRLPLWHILPILFYLSEGEECKVTK